jgi:hypothetical protein
VPLQSCVVREVKGYERDLRRRRHRADAERRVRVPGAARGRPTGLGAAAARGDRLARRAARHPGSSRQVGPRRPALPVLPRVRGTRPAARLVARAIGIIEGTVKRVLVEDDHLCGVEMDDGPTVPRRAVRTPALRPEQRLTCRPRLRHRRDRWPVKDGTGHTTVPGVWVAGNPANPQAQVITAAGEGSAAAIAIRSW